MQSGLFYISYFGCKLLKDGQQLQVLLIIIHRLKHDRPLFSSYLTTNSYFNQLKQIIILK